MGKLRTVGVRFYREDSWRTRSDEEFSSTRVYQYLTDQDAKEGDFALVFGAGNALCITKVVSVRSFPAEKATKFIVAIVSLEAYKEKMARLEEMKTLREELQHRITKLKERQKLEDAINDANDEEGKVMLARLKELEGAE